MNNEEQYANLELGKTYDFMGYKWTACELINNGKTLVIQSHGVTTGPWPGFKMSQFGNGHYYWSDIDGQDISSYDDKTQKLYDAIKDFEDTSATYGNGLYLVSAEKAQLPTVIYGASGAGYYCDALVSAGSEGNPNGTHCNAWLGTLGNKENTAWFVNCFANGYIALQDDVVKTIAPAFNLDLSKVEIKGDEIVKKTQPALSSKYDDNCSERPHLGKTYDFMGYKWTACELINNGKTLVIQSHGVTHGAWPGYVMPQFGGNADTFYTADIAGEDISAYDDKMQALYDAIKDVEDKSAAYGRGLYLISKEKVGFTKLGDHGSGNYWQALKKAAENARSFGDASVNPFGSARGGAWFSAAFGSYYAWFVYSVGGVYGNYNQDSGNCVIAPVFNLDLSKVEIKGDEIIKKSQFDFASMAVATPSDNNLSANSNHTSMSAADAKNLFKDFAERLPSDAFYEMSQNNSSIQPDDSAVEDRKAQFIIAEQGIAELAGAVIAQSDSSKELTDDDRLVELCKEASQRAASDDSYVPNLVLQICKRFNWDVNERYDDVEEILSQIVSTGLQITSETVSKSDIFERMFCLLTNLNFTDFIHNYTEQPASADSPKKMDL